MKLRTFGMIAMMGSVLANLVSCRSTPKLVVDPSGWEVISFECEYTGADSSELLHINENDFEHIREGIVRGQKVRIIVKGNRHRATMQTLWVSSAGKEQAGSLIPMDREKIQHLFQDYTRKYFMFSPFPTDAEVSSMIGAKEGFRTVVSFCGRKAYQLVSGQVTEIVDARTGIRLARYNGDRELQRLVYARWKLKKGNERGYYEIRCSQD